MGFCFGLAPVDLRTIVSDVPAAHVARRLDAMQAWRRPDLTTDLCWSAADRRLSAVSPRRFGTLRDRAVVTVETAGAGSRVGARQVPNRADAVTVVAAVSGCVVLSLAAVPDPTRVSIALIGLCSLRLLVPAGRRADTRRFAAVLAAACDPRLELPAPLCPDLPDVDARPDDGGPGRAGPPEGQEPG